MNNERFLNSEKLKIRSGKLGINSETSPLPGRGLGRGGNSKSSEQSNSPSLEFVSSLSFANKFFSLPWRDIRNDNRNNATASAPLKAFSLAEVLITLGVIGVVAGMTMPTLIAHHKKKVVVTRMQKFYSSMNQALKLSETQNGEYQYWNEINLGRYNPDTMYDWYKRYLADYFKSKDIEKTADGILVANTDGSAFGLYNSNTSLTTIHVLFCPEYKGCKNFLKANNNKILGALDGKNTFLLNIDGGNLKTYGLYANITREQAKNGVEGNAHGCAKRYKAYCSALIQMDGWQIADDYPVKF